MFRCARSRNVGGAAPEQSFITLKRILIIKTICVARRFYSRRFPAMSRVELCVGHHRAQTKEMRNQKRSSSADVAEQQLLFDAFALFVLCRCPFMSRHNLSVAPALRFLMKCILSAALKMDMYAFFSFVSSAHGFAGLVAVIVRFELLSCVKQTMRILGHGLIVNEYLIPR